MDPITAALLIGAATTAVTAGIGMYQGQQQAKAVARAQNKAQDKAVKNQNALVEEGFNKRRNAMGLGAQQAQGGQVASQTGSVLTSVTNGNQASGL